MRARTWRAAGLSDLVEIREGDALETLARDLPETIDLVLLDGAKPLYPRVLSLIEKRLRVGALIVADNADWCADYLARVRSPNWRISLRALCGGRRVVDEGRSALVYGYPFTQTTWRSVWTISTRSACAAITASIDL